MTSLRQLGTILSRLEIEFVLRIEPRYLASSTSHGESVDTQSDLADEYVLIPEQVVPGAETRPNGCAPVHIVDQDVAG